MGKASAVSITDIAREAGVSITTVSRILNRDASLNVSEDTRARVQSVASQLGYQANPLAAALRGNRTGIIGALSPNLAGTFLPLLTLELQRVARTRQVELLIGSPEVERNQMEGQIKKLQSQLFDGLLLLSDVLDYQATIRTLEVLRKPYVSVCAGLHVPAPLVNIDDEAAMRMAVGYLYRLGHTRIAYLGSVQWRHESYRIDTFRTAMHEHGLTIQPEYIALMEEVTYMPQERSFRNMWTIMPLQTAQALLSLPRPPTAILCANDGFALAALKGALQMGLRVPDDVSILGHNDEIPSTLFYPELTTIRQPVEQIAEIAVTLLLDMINNGETAATRDERVLVAPELVVRGTCAAVRP
jgi:DNA-binding LacI/PurR family transcriptional regulator